MIKVDDKDLPSEKVRRARIHPLIHPRTRYHPPTAQQLQPIYPPPANQPPTHPQAIWENAHALARYAAIAQENGLVPIVEPEVTLGEGDYSIERTAYISERVNSIVMNWLNRYDVVLEAILLKPNMILPGLDAPVAAKEEVAKYTVQVMKRTIPPAVPGIHFLSGGMGEEEATLNLLQLQVRSARDLSNVTCVT